MLIIGNAKSGKTCILENMMMQSSAGSFGKNNNFLSYVGSRMFLAQRYFKDGLFSDYVSPYAGERHAIAVAHISQQGCAEEFDQATREKQGQRFESARRPAVESAVISPPPRIALYIDHCEYEEKFVKQCLMPTHADEMAHKTINVIELDDCAALPEWSLHNLPHLGLIVFTSPLDIRRHQSALKTVLGCSSAIVSNLIQSANLFIHERNIALVIHLHQWRATKQQRGFHIYKYDLVPPLTPAPAITNRNDLPRAKAATLPRLKGNSYKEIITEHDTESANDVAEKTRLCRTNSLRRRRRTKHM